METMRDRFLNLRLYLILIFISTSPLSYAKNTTVVFTKVPNYPEVTNKDPYEKFNRFMFGVNEFVDKLILKPVATLYNKIIPHPLNLGIHNFFMNINNIPTAANDILQFHFRQAANDLWRLAINSTIGIGGLFDVAKHVGLQPYSNDFGLTLAHYGYKNSTYLVLPFLGPNTFRDAIGIPVDYYGLSIFPYIEPDSLRYGLYGLSMIDARAQLLKYQALLEEVAVDKYAFQRNAYLQRRAFKIRQNEQLNVGDQINTLNVPQDTSSMPGVNIGIGT